MKRFYNSLFIKKTMFALFTFTAMLSYQSKLMAQPCFFNSPKNYDLSVAESSEYIGISPLDATKLWIRNEYRTQSYELDLQTGQVISLSEKFGLPKGETYYLKNTYLDSTKQVIWLGMSNFLVAYDLKTKQVLSYEIGHFIDFLPTKDHIFFLGEKGVFVYERKSNKFSTLFSQPNFTLIGLCLNPSNGFIFINPNTFIIEETLKINYCTNDTFEVKRNVDLNSMKKPDKYDLYDKTKPLFGSILENAFAVEDTEGFWKVSEHEVAFYNKNSKEIYHTFSIFDLTHNTFSDVCSLYCYSYESKKMYIYPKKYLFSGMKKLDILRFEKERKLYDSLYRKQIWNTNDCTFEEFEKKYYAFKKQYIDTAYNVTIKADFQRSISPFFGYMHFNKKHPILASTTEKAIDEGRFPEEFGDLPKLYIRRLAREGEFTKAFEKYELYSKLYKKQPLFATEEDEKCILSIKNAILYAKKIEQVKAPDSLLWFKSASLLSYRQESPWEQGTYCEVLNPLVRLLKEYPNSALAEECEYRLFTDRDARSSMPHSVANFRKFYKDTILLYQHFLEKYPKSKYRHTVLSWLINYYSFHYEREPIMILKQNFQLALKMIEDFNREFPNQPFSEYEKKALEERIEFYSWEGEIKLSQTTFQLNQPVFYTIRLKNIGKNIKKIGSIGCNKHPNVRFNILYGDKQINWDGNLISFCTELEPPKCSKEEIVFHPNEEKTYQGVLEHIPFYGDKVGTLKLLKKGIYKIEIGLNGLIDTMPFEFKIE
jgi:hypothetical protein